MLRISYKSYCAKCNNDFKLFELIHYIPDDNDSICDNCKTEVNYHSFVSSIFLGRNSDEVKENIIILLKALKNKVSEQEFLKFIRNEVPDLVE